MKNFHRNPQAYEKKTTPKWRYDLGRKKNFEQVCAQPPPAIFLSFESAKSYHGRCLERTRGTGSSPPTQRRIREGCPPFRAWIFLPGPSLVPRSFERSFLRLQLLLQLPELTFFAWAYLQSHISMVDLVLQLIDTVKAAGLGPTRLSQWLDAGHVS